MLETKTVIEDKNSKLKLGLSGLFINVIRKNHQSTEVNTNSKN